jgi:hypothetical protein
MTAQEVIDIDVQRARKRLERFKNGQQAMIEFWNDKDWITLGYPSFSDCVQKELGYTKQHANRLKLWVTELTEWSPIGDQPDKPANEWQARQRRVAQRKQPARLMPGSRAEKILKVIEASSDGLIDEEIGNAFEDNPHPATIQSARKELVVKGYVKDSGEKRAGESGFLSTVWVLGNGRSTTNHLSIAACRTETAEELLRSIELDLNVLLSQRYTLSTTVKARLQKILTTAQEKLS